MSTVSVNPPRTPVTTASSGKALATTPNVCKMPGPPAPFVPTPLPNLGQSGCSMARTSTTVKIEGSKVAIKGTTFMSRPSGDVASQGTGGGILSAKTQGKSEFVAPGSMDVKIEGKNVQLLGDAMTNNGGSPANAVTMKELQAAVGDETADAICEAVRNNYGSGRGQSKRAEKEFLASKEGSGWTRQCSVKLETSKPLKCRPDLYNSTTNVYVELKDIGERYTPNQKKFITELEQGAHSPLGPDNFVTVSPATCA